jgi:hypothetical protein
VFLLLLNGNGLPQTLYVGANYHPHDDKNPNKVQRDINLMKPAGLNVVWAASNDADYAGFALFCWDKYFATLIIMCVSEHTLMGLFQSTQ